MCARNRAAAEGRWEEEKREEGVALNNSCPDSFEDEWEVEAILHHLGYQLWLWTLTFRYLPCPMCLPLRPAQEEGVIAHEGLLSPLLLPVVKISVYHRC